MHQGQPRAGVSLVYGVREGQIGLFLRCDERDRETVIEPIIAGYPEATVTLVDEAQDIRRALGVSSPREAGEILNVGVCESLFTEIELVPELFPILRHAQFEDMLNHNFADPVSGLLRAILPEEGIECRIEITVRPASKHRAHQARRAVMLLEREFFRRHHRLASYFAKRITRPRRWQLAWLLGWVAKCSPHPTHTNLETSTSRLHEREEDLQAAADKLGGHLFETRIQLIVETEPSSKSQALDRLRRMAGALGAFTRSRLATFESTVEQTFLSVPSSPDKLPNKGRSPFLLSHEELATLWHPPTSTNDAGVDRMIHVPMC